MDNKILLKYFNTGNSNEDTKKIKLEISYNNSKKEYEIKTTNGSRYDFII